MVGFLTTGLASVVFCFPAGRICLGREQLPREVIALRWLRRLAESATGPAGKAHPGLPAHVGTRIDAPQYWLVFSPVP